MISEKYQSKMKRFDSAKVIIFANFAPQTENTLSADRWNIIHIPTLENKLKIN